MLDLFWELYTEIIFIIDNIFTNQVAFDFYGSKTLLVIIGIGFLFTNLIIKWRKKDRSYLYVFFKFVQFTYLIMVFKYVFLPIPVNSLAITYLRETYGEFSIDLHYIMSILPIIGIFYSTAKLSFLLNIGLFVPFSIFYKLFDNEISSKAVIKKAFMMSVSIELIQLSLSLLWNTNYRSFDFNDIIANTLGAAVGIVIFNFVSSVYNRLFTKEELHVRKL